MNNEQNLTDKFKDIYISDQNKNYIINLVYTKLYKLHPKNDINKNNELYISHLNSLQTYIFTSFFTKIYSDLHKQNKLSLENVIILLNKLTMEQFEQLILHDLKLQKTQKPKTVFTQQMSQQMPQEFEKQLNEQLIKQKELEKVLKEKEVELEKHKEMLKNVNSNKIKMSKNICLQTEKNDINKHEFKEKKKHEEIMTSYHLISNDAHFLNGSYNFKIDTNKIKSIHLNRFWMACNMYNINEYNNHFSIYENEQKININIPIGYYKIDDLVNTIEILLNKYSINKLKYKVFHDNFKNKVFFSCTKDDIPFNFILIFENQNLYTSLNKILGFKLLEYSGNNIYVSENHSRENIFDNIYLRMFLDDKEVCKYIMSNGSSYFECFNLNYGNYFGKGFDIKKEETDVFDIFGDVDCKEISVEFIDSENNMIIKPIEFHIVIGLECLE